MTGEKREELTMKPWNFVLRPRIRNYNVIIFDTEELPCGDFVLWLAIKDLPETARYFVNPSAKFVQTLIKRLDWTLPHRSMTS